MTLKKTLTTSSLLVGALWVALVGGCGGTEQTQSEGGTANYQGDNLSAEDARNGGGGMADPSTGSGADDDPWTTLCHIPPGNHARAHTITVGTPAVKAHLKHGDTLGPCEGEGGGDGADAGTGEPGSDGGTTGPGGDPQPDAGTGSGEPDGGAVCQPINAECGPGVTCCDGLQCSAGRCTLILQ